MTSKKYYWLKLKEDFFEDDTINWIEDQPGGEKYSLFYLKLCLKSLKTNGILIRNVGEMLIPYDVKKLAEITRTDIDTVRVAMELFKNIGLVQILENGEIYLSQLKTMVGSESKWAKYKREERLETKKPPLLDNVQPESKDSPIEIEKEKEKEKEKEIELTDIQRERIEFFKPLFDSWSVSDDQINYLIFLLSNNMPFDILDTPSSRDIKMYDEMQKLTLKAKADNVKHIKGWLEKVIPNTEF